MKELNTFKQFLADDPKPQRLGPSSQFTFEPNDPKKDLMIHKIVDEYQDKIFDYLWNYELYKNEYSKDFGKSVNEGGNLSDSEVENLLTQAANFYLGEY